MKGLSLRQPTTLAVAEGATTPVAAPGSEIWSSTASKKLVYNGSNWVSAYGKLGNAVGPGSSVYGQLAKFADTSGKVLTPDGFTHFPTLYTITSDVTVPENTFSDLFLFYVPPRFIMNVEAVMTIQVSVSGSVGGVGARVNTGAGGVPGHEAGFFSYLNLATTSAASGVGFGGRDNTSLLFFNTAGVSAANANVGQMFNMSVKNTDAAGGNNLALLFTALQSTIGGGNMTVKAGSMVITTLVKP